MQILVDRRWLWGCACLLASCAQSHLEDDAGSHADTGGLVRDATVADADDHTVGDGTVPDARPPDDATGQDAGPIDPPPSCHWDPMADRRYVGGGGTICGLSSCEHANQALVDSGVTYSACGRNYLTALQTCDFEECVPASATSTLADGSDPPSSAGWSAFCCGDGPACDCTELCWARDSTMAPHCIPRP